MIKVDKSIVRETICDFQKCSQHLKSRNSPSLNIIRIRWENRMDWEYEPIEISLTKSNLHSFSTAANKSFRWRWWDRFCRFDLFFWAEFLQGISEESLLRIVRKCVNVRFTYNCCRPYWNFEFDVSLDSWKSGTPCESYAFLFLFNESCCEYPTLLFLARRADETLVSQTIEFFENSFASAWRGNQDLSLVQSHFSSNI